MFEGGHQPASPRVINGKKKLNRNIPTSIPRLTDDHAFVDIKMPRKEKEFFVLSSAGLTSKIFLGVSENRYI